MHRATLPRFILTHRLTCSHLTSPRSNTPMPTRTITRTWSLASEKSSLPLRCVIKPSPQWTTMPKLQVGHIVAVNGFILRVLQKDDGKVQFFEVEVEQVNILGKTSVPIGPNQFVDTGKSILFFLWVLPSNFILLEATSTPLKQKGLQFDFSQATPSPLKKARISDTPSSPSPLPRS